MEGTQEQGIQSPITPAQRYRMALAALDRAQIAQKELVGMPVPVGPAGISAALP